MKFIFSPLTTAGGHCRELQGTAGNCRADLQTMKVMLVRWKMGFLPQMSKSGPKISELKIIPT